VLLFALVAVFGLPSQAGMDEGIAALRRGDYATAAKELRPLAEGGNAEAQYRVGLMYGNRVPLRRRFLTCGA